MITLSLLHPIQATPVQTWTFETESLIRIGRANDNDVVVYSAVVSRHHLEIHCTAGGWEVSSLGANGTYVNQDRITKVKAVDGMILRLGSSGPKIQIWLRPMDAGAMLKATPTKRVVQPIDAPDAPTRPKSTFLTPPKMPTSSPRTEEKTHMDLDP